MKKTTYQIINQGHSISPNKDRDEYYKEEWVKVEDILKMIEDKIIEIELEYTDKKDCAEDDRGWMRLVELKTEFARRKR